MVKTRPFITYLKQKLEKKKKLPLTRLHTQNIPDAPFSSQLPFKVGPSMESQLGKFEALYSNDPRTVPAKPLQRFVSSKKRGSGAYRQVQVFCASPNGKNRVFTFLAPFKLVGAFPCGSHAVPQPLLSQGHKSCPFSLLTIHREGRTLHVTEKLLIHNIRS